MNVQTNYIVSIIRMVSINFPKINEKYWKTKKLENTDFLFSLPAATGSNDDTRKGVSSYLKVIIFNL